MFLTEIEIKAQYTAAKLTLDCIKKQWQAVKNLGGFKTVVISGCGSGLCISQSAAVAATKRLCPAIAVASGDIMQNAKWWEGIFKDSLVIFPSRSGATSEVLKAAEAAKAAGAKIVSISAVSGSPLARLSDVVFEIDWAYDASVCQTRTVSCLYTACMALIALLSDDILMLNDLEQAIAAGDSFLHNIDAELKAVAETVSFDNAVLLADTEIRGLAAEAALAFGEISQIPSISHNILDFRHGPIVMLNKNSLMIVANILKDKFTEDILRECKSKGAYIISVGPERCGAADKSILTPKYAEHAPYALPFINTAQLLAFYKAVKNNVNPDYPQGLNPYIKL